MQTEFALAERATAQTLAEDIMDVKDLPLVIELTDVLADAFIILNFHRQIVYCNPSLGAQGDGREIELWVMNPSAMPEEVRMQIFQRSFSTKGKGRGIGTYSLKLLGETYLKGEVGFTSAEDEGTRFFIRLPIGV